MQSIFRYPGGKSKKAVQEWIREQRPSGAREYREPFVGGGGVFWALDATLFPRQWINDRHAGLVAVYRALRDRPDEFIAACRAIPPARPGDPLTERGERGGLPVNARLKGVFDGLALNGEADQALRYFFVNRTVFGGRVNYDIPSRLYFSNERGWDIVGTTRLERAARRLRGVEITNLDYAELLSAGGDDVWVYCDPPYVVNTEMTATSQLYQYGFTEDDHKRFARAVDESPHRVAVSYDDDPAGFVRGLFAGPKYHILERQWAYSGTTNETKERGRELLICNYRPFAKSFALYGGCDRDAGPEMRVHPHADHWRDYTPAELAALRADIEAHGVRLPVWTWRGWIIDGRHRWKVCKALGVECPTVEFTGDESEIRGFANSLNDPRRHLSDADRAFAAASMANLKRGDNQFTGDASRDASPVSQFEAARQFNVGRASVQRARQVLDAGAGLVEAVKANVLPLRLAADVAALPEDRRRAILAAECPKKAAREATRRAPVVPPPPTPGPAPRGRAELGDIYDGLDAVSQAKLLAYARSLGSQSEAA